MVRTSQTLRGGALRDAQSIVSSSKNLQALILSYNATDRIYHFHNGSFIEFKSFSNWQDAKSGKRDYLFINEANGVPFNIYFEVALRTTKQIFIDYNPNCEFWVHEQLIGQPGTKQIISDHRHNPFISDKVRQRIEDVKKIDLELWQIYARGMTGKVEGVVFRNWDTVAGIPEHAELLSYGLDFGFTNDPTAHIAVYKGDNSLYLKELIYETNLTNPQIAERLKSHTERITVCDSSEPKSIKELQDLGARVTAAKKGPDSVTNSIDILKRYKLHITSDSPNLRKELLSYKWKADKNGKYLNEPVDFNNHLIDALRYVALNNFSHNYGKYRILGTGAPTGRR